jgi:uncharacterized membrane protein
LSLATTCAAWNRSLRAALQRLSQLLGVRKIRLEKAEEILMRKRILAGAAMLALATGVMTSAVASEHKTGRSGSHIGRVHVGGMHAASARRGSPFASEGGWQGGNVYGHGGYKSLGPLGITFGCGQRGSCGQGYSVSAWSY